MWKLLPGCLCQTCMEGSGGSAGVEGPVREGTGFWEGWWWPANTPTGSFSRMNLSALSFCQSCQTICLLLNSDKRDPSLALTWLALPASPLLQADLKAWHLGQEPHPQPAWPPPLSIGSGGGSATGAFLSLGESEAGHWPLALGSLETCQNKKPWNLKSREKFDPCRCLDFIELEPRPWLNRISPK